MEAWGKYALDAIGSKDLLCKGYVLMMAVIVVESTLWWILYRFLDRDRLIERVYEDVDMKEPELNGSGCKFK
jgi:hypothetical protein